MALRSARQIAPRSFTRFVSGLTAREQAFFEDGVLCERGLTQFDTLYEMQTRSCEVFDQKPLFGTHTGDKFEWMSYQEFDSQVNRVRALLKDMGALQTMEIRPLERYPCRFLTLPDRRPAPRQGRHH